MGQGSLPLTDWANFYVILGSSAGALTGLQFIVMTLIAQTRMPASPEDVRAFGTPTVVHFSTALLISAMMAAPWPSLSNLDIGIGVCGGLGVVYALLVLWHAWKAPYNPDAEDWIWYGVLPLLAYAALGAAAMVLVLHPMQSLFVIAGTTLVLLLIGIHNCWDTVTYVAVHRVQATHNGDHTE
jgi:hypothetical protein